MLKATATALVPLDGLSQRMPVGTFLASTVFQLFHFLHVFLLGHTLKALCFFINLFKKVLDKLLPILYDSSCAK